MKFSIGRVVRPIPGMTAFSAPASWVRKMLVVLLLLPISAHSATWTLDNVLLSDGGVMTGSFDYSGGIFSNIDITTSGGLQSSYTYTPAEFVAGTANSLFLKGLSPSDGGNRGIALFFFSPLTGGGTSNVVPFISYEAAGPGDEDDDRWGDWGLILDDDDDCNDDDRYGGGDDDDGGCGWKRYVITGSATVVPVPAGVWLFGSALLGLGVIKRKRR